MLKLVAADKSGIPLDVHAGLDDHPTRITESLKTLDAHWRASAITTATTTIVVPARAGASLMMTDIVVILTKKVTAATIVVSWECSGGYKVPMFSLDAGTASFQFSHAFQGGMKGWKDADIVVITNDTTTLSVLVGYVHISTESTQSYSEWNSER